jgi:hypothetical protein
MAKAIAWVVANKATDKFAGSLYESILRWGSLTDRQAQAALRNIERTPRAPQTDPVQREGVYAKRDGADVIGVYRVKKSQAGNLYAMSLNLDSGEFTYVKGGIFALNEADRLSLQEACAIGQQWGRCIVCGAPLSDPKSIAAGIGPVCVKRI